MKFFFPHVSEKKTYFLKTATASHLGVQYDEGLVASLVEVALHGFPGQALVLHYASANKKNTFIFIPK